MSHVTRLAAALCLLLTAACAKRIMHYPAETRVSALDFRPHSADGFMFSPNSFSGPHRVIGMVTISMRAEATLPPDSLLTWRIGTVPVDSALARAKAAVKQLGGDALVNFTIRPTSYTINLSTVIPGIEISGLAIAREPSR